MKMKFKNLEIILCVLAPLQDNLSDVLGFNN